MNDIELFWMEIFSEEPERVRKAYLSLTQADERDSLYEHLQRMVTEEGWADPQRESAQAALKVIIPLREG